MQETRDGALILQGDKTILLDVHHPRAEEARRAIGPFAELEKSPEHLHTYRISPLSLWNAAAAGLSVHDLSSAITSHSRYPVASHVFADLGETMARYGLLDLHPSDSPDFFLLAVHHGLVHAELGARKEMAKYLLPPHNGDRESLPASPGSPAAGLFRIRALDRGTVKQELIRLGWPVQDRIPLRDGESHPMSLRDPSLLRPYQAEAVESLLGDGRPGLGYGTIVLPCGSGKTIVGIGTMARLSMCTLILTVNVAAVHQWIREIRERCDLGPDSVGEYTGFAKDIRPITVATYQILAWRPDKEGDFPHFSLLKARNWGLIIYDEVHLLPAPVFRITAEIQALRRMGLTATLVREDGRESDVFSLVGPKRYDVPWKDMEAQGWIASVNCEEIRCDLPEHLQVPYAVAGKREKFRLASENPVKIAIAEYLVHQHAGEPTLVIGMYLDQLEDLSRRLDAPLITGKTPNARRDELYGRFRDGDIRLLIVSKVANFAIDLPDASVAIQVSGTFGSRQEEAQRLGRILRPKGRPSFFYTLTSRYTVDEEFSANRQQFLTEQGYRYSLRFWEDTAEPSS